MKYYDICDEITDTFQNQKIIFAYYMMSSYEKKYHFIYLLVYKKDYEQSKKILEDKGCEFKDSFYQKCDFKIYLSMLENYPVRLEQQKKTFGELSMTIQNGEVHFEDKTPFYVLNYQTMKKVLKQDQNDFFLEEVKKNEQLNKKIGKDILIYKPQKKFRDFVEQEIYLNKSSSLVEQDERYQKMKEACLKEKNTKYHTLDIVNSFSETNIEDVVGSKNKVFLLPFIFEIGDLKELERKRTSLEEIDPDYLYDDTLLFAKLDWFASKVKKIRIWTSHCSANCYLLFLFCCHYLKDKKISVLYADEEQENINHAGMLDYKELKSLIKKEHVLRKKEKNAYDEEWHKILEQNSDIRFLENKKLKCVSYEYVENILYQIISFIGPITDTRFSSFLMDHYVDFDAPVVVYQYLTERMIQENKIKVIGIQTNNYRKERILKAV